jgi:hypothetical protein
VLAASIEIADVAACEDKIELDMEDYTLCVVVEKV